MASGLDVPHTAGQGASSVEMQSANISMNNRPNNTAEITSAEPSAPSVYNFMAYPAVYQQPPYHSAPAASHPILDSLPYYMDQTPLPSAPHTQLMSLQQSHSPKPYDANRINLFVDADPMSPTTPAPYSTATIPYGAAAGTAMAAATAGVRASSSPAPGSTAAAKPIQQESSANQWLVPDAGSQQYWALWTSLFTLCACFVFAFMAGGFGTYQQSITFMQYHNGTSSQSALTTAWGPSAMVAWLKFWRPSAVYSFDVGYLMAWGARHLPTIAAGEWWRLFSSICIHGSFSHLFSNMFALVVLAVPLEHTYGPLRIFVIFLAAGFGGTFMSMAFEDPCYVYVGASGAVFGFLGLYLADILLNFESMYRPVLRLALMLLSLGLTLGIEFATASANPLLRVSHMSHVGGLIAGLFTSFMFLPNLKDQRWKAARKFANRIGTFGHSIYDRISHGGGSNGSGTHSSFSHWGLLAKMESCWRRHAWLYRSVWVLSALVILFMFCGLPVYIWLFRIPVMRCSPLLAGGA